MFPRLKKLSKKDLMKIAPKNCCGSAFEPNLTYNTAEKRDHHECMGDAEEWGHFRINHALESAGRRGDIVGMQIAVMIGADNVDFALWNAAEYGHVEAMKMAVTLGAKDLKEATMYAVKNGRVECARLLHFYGGKISPEIAMHIGAERGYPGVMRAAKDWGATDFSEAIAIAAEHGHMECMVQARNWGGSNFPRAIQRVQQEISRPWTVWEVRSTPALLRQAEEMGIKIDGETAFAKEKFEACLVQLLEWQKMLTEAESELLALMNEPQ